MARLIDSVKDALFQEPNPWKVYIFSTLVAGLIGAALNISPYNQASRIFAFLAYAPAGFLLSVFVVFFVKLFAKLRSPEGRAGVWDRAKEDVVTIIVSIAMILVSVGVIFFAGMVLFVAFEEYEYRNYVQAVEDLRAIEACENNPGCMITVEDAKRAKECNRILSSASDEIRQRYRNRSAKK